MFDLVEKQDDHAAALADALRGFMRLDPTFEGASDELLDSIIEGEGESMRLAMTVKRARQALRNYERRGHV